MTTRQGAVILADDLGNPTLLRKIEAPIILQNQIEPTVSNDGCLVMPSAQNAVSRPLVGLGRA